MAQPYIGEIRMFGGNFAPSGWSFCNGSLLPISQYQALFQLIGTTYGGDGVNTFAVPDLQGRFRSIRGRAPACQNYPIGSRAGVGEREPDNKSIAQPQPWSVGQRHGQRSQQSFQ